MSLNWQAIYNRLFRLINQAGEGYMSGGRFISAVQRFAPDLPNYNRFIDQRNAEHKSTSRQDYYYDILMELDEDTRFRVVTGILDEKGHTNAELTEEIRALMVGPTIGPSAVVPDAAWNADRLNSSLAEMDAAIAQQQCERAVGLSYTCVEGFYKMFVRSRIDPNSTQNEIIALSRMIREYLRRQFPDYPDEVLNLIGQSSHALDRARNRFSEAHFEQDAARWLAMYTRDIANTQIRLLLHFL